MTLKNTKFVQIEQFLQKQCEMKYSLMAMLDSSCALQLWIGSTHVAPSTERPLSESREVSLRIDPHVFLSRPQDLSLEGGVKLADALIDAAVGTDRITILSAYYGTGYLESLFAALPKNTRRACSLTLVFGVEAPTKLPQAVEELRMFRKRLISFGFCSPVVRLFNKGAPFHTKLYYFKRSTQPTWFVGSANASPAIRGTRHELMVRLSGRHEALTEYINRVIDNSVVVEAVSRKAIVVSDIRSFLLNGALCYQPQHRASFTFEACPIGSEHRAVLKQNFADASKVPHADPQTEGFGFNLVNAVEQVTAEHFPAVPQARRSTSRLRFKHKAVETIYGYWLPAAYARDVQSEIRKIDADSITEMKRFAEKLNKVQLKMLHSELDSHIEGLRYLFSGYSVGIEPKRKYKELFDKFIEERRSWLADEARLERIVRRLHIEQMPDIWGDEEAAQKFEDSFFEDLAIRFDVPKETNIIRILKKELASMNIHDPEHLKDALVERLRYGFDDSRWRRAGIDDEHEE